MTWPFENDTSAITKKLANKSLKSEKRRNLMVVIAVALAAFLICFTGIVSTSLTQMQRNQVVDTYEAVWMGVEENDIETLKGVPEFERVGGYYMLGEELSEQGYHASYVYCDAQMMEIAKALWGDRIFEKCGIRRDEGGDGGKTPEIRGKRRLSARDGGANYQQS